MAMSAHSEESSAAQSAGARLNLLPTLALLSLAASIGLLLAALLIFSQRNQTPEIAAAPAGASRSVLHWQASDFTLPALSGAEIRLSELRGRVVFLNFWETWCAPCRREMPDFAAFLAEQHPEQGAIVLTINGGQDAAQIRQFYAEVGIEPLPTLLDRGRRVTASYGVLQLPQTFILDADGVARARILGAMDIAEMRAQFDEYRPAAAPS